MMVDNVAKMEEDNTLGDPIINNVEILLKLNELLRTRQENAVGFDRHLTHNFIQGHLTD